MIGGAKAVVIMIAACVLAGCTPAAREAKGELLDPEGPRDDVEVRRVVDGIIAADNAGDLDALMNYYADDAVLLPPSERPVRGVVAIRDRYERMFAESRLELRAFSRETRVAGDWAIDRGTITGRVFRKLEGDEELEEETPIRTVNDKYVMMLRRESDGGWRIVWLIWNSSEE